MCHEQCHNQVTVTSNQLALAILDLFGCELNRLPSYELTRVGLKGVSVWC